MKRLLILFIPALLMGQAETPNMRFGSTFMDSTSFVRPSDSLIYAAADVVSNSTTVTSSKLMKFPLMARYNAGRGYITEAIMQVDTAITSGSFNLYLYADSTSHTQAADNAPFVMGSGSGPVNYIGMITFNFTSEGVGSGSTGNSSYQSNLNVGFWTKSGGTGIYGRLVSTGTPRLKNGGRITIKLKGFRD